MIIMPYSEKRKKYAREWYAKNKKRLTSCPIRKAAKKETDKRDYEKHKEKRKASVKEYNRKNAAEIKRRKSDYYQRNKKKVAAERKLLRQTPEYKQYVKGYRLNNKDKINRQQRITHGRYIRKQVEQLTDWYIIGQILFSPNNKLTAAELKIRPDLIEAKRQQIKSFREKHPQQVGIDIMTELMAIQKQRNAEPYEFIKEWRD